MSIPQRDLTNEEVNYFLEQYKVIGRIAETCVAVGLCRITVQRFLNRNIWFGIKINEAYADFLKSQNIDTTEYEKIMHFV